MDNPIQNIKIQPHVSIVILNWNGYRDTIECLESLSHSNYLNFEVILVDNASSDGSVEKINQWIESNLIKQITVILNPENFGFAKGNNIGISAALKNHGDYILLLNNDTVVNADFLTKLIDFFITHEDYSVATPQIRYYDKNDMIWNCGGKLKFPGSRKYFYDSRPVSELAEKEFLHVSFITGCALMMKTDLIKEIGMLTEDFFFGEEDFEFSLRLRKNKKKAACVLGSVIYHKVNSSISLTTENAIGKIYIHYLNRFINLKNFMPAWKWRLWRWMYGFYIRYLLKNRHGISKTAINKFMKSLMQNSAELNAVSKSTFDKYINFDFS